MDAAFGRNVSIRRGVNARDTSVRNREWSGGSIERMPEVTRSARIRGSREMCGRVATLGRVTGRDRPGEIVDQSR